MAITVRFPNGQAIHYNSAFYVAWCNDGSANLLDKRSDGSNGIIVAKVLPGSGAIVEFCNPCEVSNPTTDRNAALDILIKGIRDVRDTYKLAELKRELRKFNAQSKTWMVD